MPSNNPSIEELVAEGVPAEVAVLIQPWLNYHASDTGNLARGIRAALAKVSA